MEYEYKIVTIQTSPSWYGGHIAEKVINYQKLKE